MYSACLAIEESVAFTEQVALQNAWHENGCKFLSGESGIGGTKKTNGQQAAQGSEK